MNWCSYPVMALAALIAAPEVVSAVNSAPVPIHPWWIIGVSLLIALVPIIAGVATAYLKVSIILTMLRNAFGAQGVPSGLVITVISFGITCIIMAPVWERSWQVIATTDPVQLSAIPQFNKLSQSDSAWSRAFAPWREFIDSQIADRELQQIREITAVREGPLPVGAALLAFVLSEVREAFSMGLMVLLPFLAIDLIVSNLLAGLGMMMASPVMIAFPLKLLIFLLADGWMILTKGIIASYGSMP